MWIFKNIIFCDLITIYKHSRSWDKAQFQIATTCLYSICTGPEFEVQCWTFITINEQRLFFSLNVQYWCIALIVLYNNEKYLQKGKMTKKVLRET